MPGPQLLFLNRDRDLFVEVTGDRGDGFAGMSDDKDLACRFQGGSGTQGVDEQGHPSHLVQNLRTLRLHARALAGGQEDQMCRHDCSFLFFGLVLRQANRAARVVPIT